MYVQCIAMSVYVSINLQFVAEKNKCTATICGQLNAHVGTPVSVDLYPIAMATGGLIVAYILDTCKVI